MNRGNIFFEERNYEYFLKLYEQKHVLVGDFREWKHSSYGLLSGSIPTFLHRDSVLDWFGGKKAYLDLHAEWVDDARSKWFAGNDWN